MLMPNSLSELLDTQRSSFMPKIGRQKTQVSRSMYVSSSLKFDLMHYVCKGVMILPKIA